MDETRIYDNTPEIKEQSKQWVSSGERAPKKAKVGLLANKVMATVFWDARDIIHIDYLQKEKTTAFVEEKSTAVAKIYKLGYGLLPHPVYSPDLAPCDYFLFPKLKKWLGGKRFGSNKEVITETNSYFVGLEKTYYLEGIK
ncbi:histone-lysine N-methyltransferase SETMAR-like [Belonocnema kinseyi]|uniref:histone-lysine N-methyltransferase SETMAR-like n=1 Tax=Belonocnema kinseyi TaxID=2817044 RepID=UPI00143D00A5|nr:histone-lysine N-methyltransferase SETMAR-like [Belonocnema kinseyi]